MTDELHRYHRQILLPGVGRAGQERLRASHALIAGCGALGSVIADTLARAGVGTLTIIDRDLVEITNLQRQVLFDESDVERGAPKAVAAQEKIARINSDVVVHARVDDLNHRNAEHYAGDADVILDGLDNFETRYLLNDLAVKRGIPYVYGGAVSTTGVSMTVLPHPARREPPRDVDAGRTRAVAWSIEQSTPCLRCVFPEAPPPGTSPTCDTAGVLAAVVLTVAAHQATQAIKLLTGSVDAVDRSLLSIDAWTNETRRFDVRRARDAGSCPCCVGGRFEHLDGANTSATATLCGRNAVQVTAASRGDAGGAATIDLETVAARLAPHGRFVRTAHLLRGEFASERGEEGEPIHLTLFPNGRAILKGTSREETARSLYAKYVGI